MLSRAAAMTVIAVIGVVLPKLIIDEISGQNRLLILFAIVIVLSLAILLCNLISSDSSSKGWYRVVMLRLGLALQRGKKLMGMDFEHVENPKILDKLEQSNKAVSTYISKSGCAVSQILLDLFLTVPNQILSLVCYLMILLRSSPLIVVLIAATIGLQYWGNGKISALQIKLEQELAPLYRKKRYYEEQMEDVGFAKEIRIYHLLHLLMKKYDFTRGEAIGILGQIEHKICRFRIFDLLINLLRYGMINVFLFDQVICHGLSIGDFSLYLAASIAFATAAEEFIKSCVKMNRHAILLNDFYDFLALPDGNEQEKRPAVRGALSFDRVSFSYPGTDTAVLKDLSLTIQPGERIALVGVNGCGKSTFVKLLVGLYRPTGGTITYGGEDVQELNRNAYFDLFSTVFQDVNLFAMTIAENICLCEQQNINYDKLKNALILSGLWDDVKSLKDTYNHHLMRIFEEDGIVFSGGQAQKLAMARALYQDHGIVILDEPTASLDPLAEYNLYYQFDRIIQNKTAIYISHRLSSTRFCDKIALIDSGRIAEYGTHDELMAKNGLYAEMFEKQAHYYKDGGKDAV